MLRPHARRLALLALLALLAVPAPASALDRAQLAGSLDRQMRYAGSGSGAYAVDLQTGSVLYDRRGGTRRIPASVTKLFTTAAALRVMGPDERLVTEAVAAAPVDADGSVLGDLHLVGGGDPSFGPSHLRVLTRQLRAAGVRRIAGTVVGDGRLFDSVRGTPYSQWRPHFQTGGALGALVYRRGWGAGGRLESDPADAAARALRRALVRAGVRVGTRPVDAAPPETPHPLAAVSSPTVAALARWTNVSSDNFVAEMLLKTLAARAGGPGSTPVGARVAHDALRPLGVRPRLADGSGLARRNRTTPREVVRLLDRMAAGEVAEPFRRSLAVAGRTGTVRKRMRGTAAHGRCQVKTGTLIGVSTLAGYCRTRSGREVAFAWLMNNVNSWGARYRQDRMTAALAQYRGPASGRR